VLHEWFAFPIAGAEVHSPLSARLRSVRTRNSADAHRTSTAERRTVRASQASPAPGAGGAPPAPEGQKPLFTAIFRNWRPGAHCAHCATDRPVEGVLQCASSGKLFLGRMGGPGASAPLGGRQGTLGPVPVHFGRDWRAEAQPGGSHDDLILMWRQKITQRFNPEGKTFTLSSCEYATAELTSLPSGLKRFVIFGCHATVCSDFMSGRSKGTGTPNFRKEKLVLDVSGPLLQNCPNRVGSFTIRPAGASQKLPQKSLSVAQRTHNGTHVCHSYIKHKGVYVGIPRFLLGGFVRICPRFQGFTPHWSKK